MASTLAAMGRRRGLAPVGNTRSDCVAFGFIQHPSPGAEGFGIPADTLVSQRKEDVETA